MMAAVENKVIHGDIKNKMLKKMDLKRGRKTGSWRKFHKEMHNLYFPSNIINVIK
jgi:hypothetical protein